ncbi:MAG TPA: PIN domain-containing protein [Fimbriimonadaceae bacterium]|jgi:uncharacterized protein YacL
MKEELETTQVVEAPPHRPSAGQIARLAFLVFLGGLAAFGFVLGTSPFLIWVYAKTNIPDEHHLVPLALVASGILGFLLGAGLGNLLLGWLKIAIDRWDKMDSGDKVTLFAGVFLGLLASTPFLFFLFNVISPLYFPFVTLILIAGLSALIIYILTSMSDILPWTRGRVRGKRTGTKLLDTNVIIDGRIYDVARTGFLEGNLYVPGFVLDELQFIADSHDPLRRQRGRRGLEVLRHMQTDFQLELRTQDRLAPDTGDGVDSRLVRLARIMGADIVTNDFNLNRVAALQEVKVLNINDLALGLRPNVLPSESLTLSIVREGNQPSQGIGYLEDGTMVVVENGKGHIGETLDVTVSQVIQTERGKMIFAEVPEGDVEPSGHEYGKKRFSTRRN